MQANHKRINNVNYPATDEVLIFLLLKGPANQYKGIVDCVQTIIKEEGPSAFLKVHVFCVFFHTL
jgi:hypothetical protein